VNQKNRRKQKTQTSGQSDSHTAADASEVWDAEKPSRHKWFRKRKKRGASPPRRFDDEIDEEDDRPEARVMRGWSSPRYAEPPDDGRAVGEEFAARAAREKAWGLASAIDLYDCDPALIRDAEAIRRFVVELCDLIEMKRFGETQVVHFGEDERVAGYSMVQLIETSLISAHFANQTNAVYLDVFSCKPYNPQIVREFSQTFFRGVRSRLQVAIRR